MKWFLNSIAVLAILLASLFAQTGSPSRDIRIINDISYVENSQDSMQRLNLVLPSNTVKPPLLLWIGGGAWAYVDRNKEMDIAKHLAHEGIAVASVGHRLSPALLREPKNPKGITHPKHVEDIASSFKWLKDNASTYSYDPDKIFVGGFSSGAYLSALLAMDGRYLQSLGLSTASIKGVIPVGGAYDIENYHQVFLNGTQKELAKIHVEAVFGDPKGFKEASVTEYVEGFKIPMLLVSDNQTYNYTKLFEDRLNKSKVPNLSVVHVKEFGHGALWRDLSGNKESSYRKRIVSFIKEVPE